MPKLSAKYLSFRKAAFKSRFGLPSLVVHEV